MGHAAITVWIDTPVFLLSGSGPTADAFTVGQGTAIICRGNWSILLPPSGRSVAIPALSFQSRALGVTQGDALNSSPFSRGSLDRAPPLAFLPPVTSATVGVGHSDPVLPVPFVRTVDRESRDIDCPAGVVFSLQTSAHSVEPTIASLSRNLLSHKDSGPVGSEQSKYVRPQVPWIIFAGSFARDRERLAGTRGCPNRSVVGPACDAAGERPSSDSREEMMLGESMKVIRLNILDRASIDMAGRDLSGGDQVFEPVGSGVVVLIIIDPPQRLHVAGRHGVGTL